MTNLELSGWSLIVTSPALSSGASRAASFGVFHAVAIDLVHRWFTGANQGRGQALYASVSFGAGVAVGSYLAGQTWLALSGAGTFALFAVFAATAWWLAWFGLHGLPPQSGPGVIRSDPTPR